MRRERLRSDWLCQTSTGSTISGPCLSGGSFNYTKFEDQITFLLGRATDTSAAWTPITQAAVASGAFPFAFRPCDLSRNVQDYQTPFLSPWQQSPRDFTYTDGGVFQNQPIGLAKNLVDGIDQHQDSDTRSYLFISPKPLDSSVSPIAAKNAVFKTMTNALLNAIFNQAGFQDWIEAETVNDTVNLLNQRATQLAGLLEKWRDPGAQPRKRFDSAAAAVRGLGATGRRPIPAAPAVCRRI